MALLVNDITPRVQYTATSSQTTFAYTFAIFEDADLKVYKTASGATPDDTADLLTLTTHYTVTGAGGTSGGNVVLVTGATTNDVITIERDIAVKRTTDYQNLGDLLSTSLNDDLDKVVMMIQQNEASLEDRIPLLARATQQAGGILIEDPVANKSLLYGPSGNTIINGPTATEISGANASAIAAAASASAASTSESNAAASAATIPTYPTLTDNALNQVRLNAAETAMEFRTPAQTLADIGAQAADVNTAKTDEIQSFTAGQSGAFVALTDAATIAMDMSLGNLFNVTLAANRTLGNPTNMVAGQYGSIVITHTSRSLAFASYWDFDSGDIPLLSTGTVVDRLDFLVVSATSIHASLALDVK